ncbi:MAG: methyltransferase domain-containing protein [Anaerolineae bacterium]|nr:methyltransferase domain-containing protein [Anaerolineae bacterium]
MREFCDYEGSDYRQRFWTRERQYEDLVERQALAALLPAQGGAVAELGAGFGRLAALYAGYERVFLVDFSRTLLRQAREDHAHDPRFTYVAADIRRLPLAADAFDAVVTVRVLHHLRDIRPALAEAHRILRPEAPYLLEFASKRHLKAVIRYLARRQPWNPFTLEPVEFAELNFDFHPAYIRTHLADAGLEAERWSALSLFRWAPLKRRFSPRSLAGLENLLRPLASLYPLTPSILVRARARKPAAPEPSHLLGCPHCHGPLEEEPRRVLCPACRRQWPVSGGILDFKEEGQPLERMPGPRVQRG